MRNSKETWATWDIKKGLTTGLVLKMFLLSCLVSVPVGAEEIGRPSVITETLYAPRHARNHFLSPGRSNHYVWYEERNRLQVLWQKISAGAGFMVDPEVFHYSCNIQTSISVLQDIRKMEEGSDRYQKLWIENRNRICSGDEPISGDMESLPARAVSDFAYLMGSYHFYNRQADEALKYFETVDRDLDAPIRPFGSYMVVRTLNSLGRKDEAYQKIADILADQSLAPVHRITDNYRFILTYGAVKMSEKLAEDHLSWLLDVVRIDPSRADDLEQAYSDYYDAMEHLDHYIPDPSRWKGRINWWLEGTDADSSRKKAVTKLAPDSELLDWLQASHALNVFSDEWLLALHLKDSTYWAQNRAIVEHAWNRWQNSDGLEWLEIVASRVHPSDPLASAVLDAAGPYLARSFENETEDYLSLVYRLWLNSIRLTLGQRDHEAALSLFSEDRFANISVDYQARRWDVRIRQVTDMEMPIRWLVYTGAFSEARQFLHEADRRFPGEFSHWQTLLAETWDGAVSANAINTLSGGYSARVSNLWKKMLNVVSGETLYEIAAAEGLSIPDRQVLSRVILTRSLLSENRSDRSKYALLAADLNSDMRRDILFAAESDNEIDRIDLLLRMPRLRVVPFTNRYRFHYVDYELHRHETSSTRIDDHNPNDNNWWCAFDLSERQEEIRRLAEIRPILLPSLITGKDNELDQKAFEAEWSVYNENLLSLLSDHPYQQRIDTEEIALLESVPNAPKYLTEKVIQFADRYWWQFWKNIGSAEETAERLHYAVRTTRYGCRVNGSHGAYSQKAFNILHGKFPDSIWASATPFWFSDKHF